MQWRNSELSYGTVARFLHWTLAALFLLAYCAIYYRFWFTEAQTDAWRTSGWIHRCAGLSIAVFVVLRVAWRRYNPPPVLPAGPRWVHYSANVVHYALYFFMIAMPITGYLGTSVGTDIGIFAIPDFGETRLYQWLTGGEIPFEEWEVPLDIFHKRIGGGLLLWMLILLHVGAALYHHFFRRDDTLLRMLPGGRPTAERAKLAD